MIHCNQVCMYNFPDDGCLKPKTAICPLSNIARDTNVLTNADHIRSMTDEELAEFIYYHKQETCSCCELTETDGACTETLCVNATLRWLKQPYKEDT